MGRTNIAVDDAVARELADEANREGKTMYALANQMLKTCLQITKNGGNLDLVFDLWRLSPVMKDLDFRPVPGEFLEWMIDLLYKTNKRELLEKAREYGEAIGRSLSILYPDFIDLIKKYSDIIERVLPIKRIEVSESDNGYIMKIVGVGNSVEATDVFNKMIEGLITSYEKIKVCRCEMSKGIIGMEVKVFPI
ncbi:MAG: hypothetical protein ACP5GS_06825 [Nitrososphaeria archaeon]